MCMSQKSRNISKAFYSNIVSDVSHTFENIELSVGKQNESFIVVLKFIYSGELLLLQIDLKIGSWQGQGISADLEDYVEQKDVYS
jgi:hypothetical protein